MNAWIFVVSVDQSVIHQGLNASNGVFKRKRLMEKWYFMEKGQRLCYYKWKVWQKLLSNSGLKKFYAYLCHASNILLSGTKYCAWKWFCSNKLYKGTNCRFIFPWMIINWHDLQTSYKTYFRYTICLVHDLWFLKKRITRCKSVTFFCGACMAPKVSTKQTKTLCTRINA